MSSQSRTISTALTYEGAGVVPRQSYALISRQRRAQSLARDAEARIAGAAYATHVALLHAQLLSAQEERAIEHAPLGDRRYGVLVDTYLGVAATELALLSRER